MTAHVSPKEDESDTFDHSSSDGVSVLSTLLMDENHPGDNLGSLRLSHALTNKTIVHQPVWSYFGAID